MQQIFREAKPRITFLKRKNADFSAHIHDDIELVYVKKGSGIASCDGKKYYLCEGSLFLIFPNQVHYYTDFVPGEYWVLIVKPSALLRYGELFLAGEPDSAMLQFPAGEDDGILYLLETTCRELERDGFSDVIAAYLTALFGKLLPRYTIERSRVSRDNMLKILQYCTNHYKEDITVDSVAGNLSLSKSCVSHIFSNRVGMNFCDYINSLRLQEAEDLLMNKHYSVSEVANFCGFGTIRTFNRAFLKKHGISPSAYRKTLQRQ